MLARINNILTRYAKAYSLTTQIRATDLLRNVPGPINLRNLMRQSIAEHNYMTSIWVSLILLELGDHLALNGFHVEDAVRASFMGLHHDDDEWEFGDLVPSLNYGCSNTNDKECIGNNSILKLYGDKPGNFVCEAYSEYKERKTPAAQLVKLCDILELFCHNRILYAHNLNLVTQDNYQNLAPEVQEESLHFLQFFGRDTSAAEVLEHKYFDTYRSLNFPIVLDEIYLCSYEAIRAFDFKAHIKMTDLHDRTPHLSAPT